MTTTNYQRNPDHLAKQLGIRVRRGALPQGWWGLYDHPRRTIVLRPGLAPIQYTCTLMHELGHAYYGHEGVSGKQELLADRWAARRLLSLEGLIEGARTEHRRGTLAADLQVLPETLNVFIDMLTPAERRHVSNALHPAHDHIPIA